jgi:hypothetical protein
MRALPLAVYIILAAISCSPADTSISGTGAEPKGAEGIAKQEEARLQPEVKKCSDFVSRQDIFIAEQNGELSAADKKSLDANGNGFYCDEPSAKFKDTRVHKEGLMPYEVAFVSDGSVPGLHTGEVTIDVTTVHDHIAGDELAAIAWDAVDTYGKNSEVGYEAAIITFRDDKSYKDIGIAVYIADQKAAELMNQEAARQGWRIEFYSGRVPPRGDIEAISISSPASATATATASANAIREE